MNPSDYEAAVEAAIAYMDELMDIAHDATAALEAAFEGHLKGGHAPRARFILRAASAAAYSSAYAFGEAYARKLGVEGDVR